MDELSEEFGEEFKIGDKNYKAIKVKAMYVNTKRLISNSKEALDEIDNATIFILQQGKHGILFIGEEAAFFLNKMHVIDAIMNWTNCQMQDEKIENLKKHLFNWRTKEVENNYNFLYT